MWVLGRGDLAGGMRCGYWDRAWEVTTAVVHSSGEPPTQVEADHDSDQLNDAAEGLLGGAQLKRIIIERGIFLLVQCDFLG
jgi:hypothetical protein